MSTGSKLATFADRSTKLRTFVDRSTRSKLAYLCRQVDTLETWYFMSSCRHVPTLCRSTGRHARNRNFATRRSQFCSNFSVYIFIAFYSSAITRVQAIPDHNPSIKSEQKTQQTTCCLAGCIPPQHNADFAEEHRTVKMATGFQVLHWCTMRGQFRRQYHLGLHTPLLHTRLRIIITIAGTRKS